MNAEEKQEFKKLQESSKGLIKSRQFPGLKTFTPYSARLEIILD